MPSFAPPISTVSLAPAGPWTTLGPAPDRPVHTAIARFLFHRASIYLSGFGVTAAEAADEIAVVSLAEQASHAKEGDGLDPAGSLP